MWLIRKGLNVCASSIINDRRKRSVLKLYQIVHVVKCIDKEGKNGSEKESN